MTNQGIILEHGPMEIMESLLDERLFMSLTITFSSDTHLNRSKSNNEVLHPVQTHLAMLT